MAPPDNVGFSGRPYPVLSRLLGPCSHTRPQALERAVRGKVVLVTGASFGIGRALALRLGQAGARLIVVARSAEPLGLLVEEVIAGGGEARAVALDLTDSAAIDGFCAQMTADGITIDIVVHNAGRSIRRLVMQSLDRAHDCHRTMTVNYLGPVQLQLGLLPAMIAQGRGGHVVNVSSLGNRLPPAPRWGAYTASKCAFDAWLQAARPELNLYGIACTSIYFGLVHTRMSAPTAAYRAMPGLTADEAAQVVCRALVKRPRVIEPWWVWPLRRLAPWCEGLLEGFWRWRLRRERDEAGSGLR